MNIHLQVSGLVTIEVWTVDRVGWVNPNYVGPAVTNDLIVQSRIVVEQPSFRFLNRS